MKNTLCLIFLFASLASTRAQHLIEITRTVYSSGVDWPHHSLITPDYAHRQKLLKMEFSNPRNLVAKSGCNNFISWSSKDVDDTLVIRSLLLIEEEVQSSAKEDSQLGEVPVDQYLKNTKRINHNHKSIKKTAQELKKDSFHETVSNILNYVNTEISETKSRKSRKTSTIVKCKNGNLNERLHACIALCRALGLPARGVSGIVLSDTIAKQHDWIEVFHDTRGWVSFDLHVKSSTTATNSIYIYRKVELCTMQLLSHRKPESFGHSISSTLKHYGEFEKLPKEKKLKDISLMMAGTSYPSRKSRKKRYEIVEIRNVSKELLDRTELNYMQSNYTEGRLALDSLVQLIPDNFDYQFWSTLYLIKEGADIDAIKSLQGLMRQVHNESQESKAFYAFAVLEASKGRATEAVNFLTNIKVMPKQIQQLIGSEPAFESIMHNDDFKNYLHTIKQ